MLSEVSKVGCFKVRIPPFLAGSEDPVLTATAQLARIEPLKTMSSVTSASGHVCATTVTTDVTTSTTSLSDGIIDEIETSTLG